MPEIVLILVQYQRRVETRVLSRAFRSPRKVIGKEALCDRKDGRYESFRDRSQKQLYCTLQPGLFQFQRQHLN